MNADTLAKRLAVLITIVEIVVLVGGLALAAGNWYKAAAIWFLGIVVEELIRFRGIKGALPSGTALTLLLVGVAVETTAWVLSFLPGLNIAQRFGVLFAGLTAEHSIIKQATSGNRFTLNGVLDFSAVEAAGGAIWASDPTLGTVVVMTITSVFEHVQGIRQGLGLRG